MAILGFGRGEEVATRDASPAWMQIMGIPPMGDGADAYSSLESFGRAPADEAWVFACVQLIANAAQSVPLRVYVRDGKTLTPAIDAGDQAGSDLQFLLDNANPVDMTGTELRGYTAASRKVWGGCYWQRVRGRFGGATQELYWLRAPDVTAVSADGRAIDYFDYHPAKAAPKRIETRDMIRFRGLNLGSQVDFMSPLSAARYDMLTNQRATIHTASTLGNRGIPDGYWTNAKGVVIAKSDQSALRRLLRSFRGPKNAGKSLVTPDLEYRTFVLPEQDAQWLNARKVSRMTVCAVLRVPLVLAGDDEKSGVYASVRDAKREFWFDTMIPELDGDADVLNNWLLPEFDPTRRHLVIAYDYSQIESIQESWTDRANVWSRWTEDQIVTPNQVRDEFRLGGKVPWGDRPIPRTQITLRPADPTLLPPGTIPSFDQTIAATEPTNEVIEQPGGAAGDEVDVPLALRAHGKRLYQQTAVRSFVANGGPLDAAGLLGGPVSDDTRTQIEAALTRRESAEQIAARFEGATA